MHARLKLYSQVLNGELTHDAAAGQVGVPVDQVRRSVEALQMAQVMRASDRAENARTSRRRWAAAGVVGALVTIAWATPSGWAQVVVCSPMLPAPLITFCTNSPAKAADVNGNFLAIINSIVNKTGSLSSIDVATRNVAATGTLTATGAATLSGATTLVGPVTAQNAFNWGTTGGQMLNLFTTGYGIGIQNSTLYQRTSGNFAWFLNGTPSGGVIDSGGGSVQMYLDSGGDLVVPNNAQGPATDSAVLTFTNAGTTPITMCAAGKFVCGIGFGYIGGDGQYWTGARAQIRCCSL